MGISHPLDGLGDLHDGAITAISADSFGTLGNRLAGKARRIAAFQGDGDTPIDTRGIENIIELV